MSLALNNLKLITEALLSPVKDYSNISKAVATLNKLFTEAVAFDELENTNQQDITTSTGKAIAARWAASCLTDIMRTRQFVLGIKDAIEERLKMNTGKPVIVFYAGTGPFATLLTPLITVFNPSQLQMVLMEINPASVFHLQKIIQQFDMQDYLIDLVQADAAIYCIPENQQPDIVVSETMNNALQKEPQVSIVANLLSQCNRKPFLIPELVKVDACLLGDTNKNQQDILLLKNLIMLDAKTAICIKRNPENVPALSPGIIVTIPSLPDLQYKQLALCTSINVFGPHSLSYNESGLTIPHILMMIDTFKKYPAHVFFQYQIESNPGFSVSKIENE